MASTDRVNECPLFSLPLHVNRLVLSQLSPADLGRLGQVCQHFRSSITECCEVWRRHCARVWLLEQLPSGCGSWYEGWCAMVAEYGRYQDCYATVKKAWTVIEKYLDKNNILLNNVSLNDRRSEEEIAAAEKELGLEFPNDLRLSFRLHDGLSSFLGVIEFYYFQSILTLHSLQDLLKFHRSSTEESFYHPPSGNTQYLQIGSGWPDKNTAAGLLLALPQARDTPSGHVVWMSTVQWRNTPTFDNQSVNYGGVLNNCSVGLIGKSMMFADWLTDCAQRLPCYPLVPTQSQHNIIMRFYRDPSVRARTRYFTITVGTVLDPSMGTMYSTENSDSIPIMPLPIVPLLATGGSYSYWVEIKMDDDAPQDERCQLVSRHWVIRYASGGVERVDGPGVIGETPVFTPGHLHQYASCTRFVNEEYCTMEGHYTMKYLDKDGTFNIQVPRFHMPRPEIKWL